MTFEAASLRLCLVTDRGLAGRNSIIEIVEAAVRGGVTMVQLREKTAATRVVIEEARALAALLRPLGIPLIVNDRVDVALAVDADGVHVGQDDMQADTVRALIGRSKIVGVSITNLDDLRYANLYAADYLGVGPVFAQTTKSDAATPLGLEGLTAMRRATDKPLVAIGGIHATNAPDVMRCGVEGVAVVSAIMAAPDPERAARDILRSG